MAEPSDRGGMARPLWWSSGGAVAVLQAVQPLQVSFQDVQCSASSPHTGAPLVVTATLSLPPAAAASAAAGGDGSSRAATPVVLLHGFMGSSSDWRPRPCSL